jgi:hypothetical protein
MAIDNHSVIFISSMETSEVKGLFEFIQEQTPNDALSKAFSLLGDQATVLVVPQGMTKFLTLTK